MSAVHIAWWAALSDPRKPPPWARHPGADCRAFSADTPGHQIPAHGTPLNPLDCGGIFHLLWHMSHSTPSQWCSGSTDGCRPRTVRIHTGSYGSDGAGRGRCSCLLASDNPQLPLEWCCHRKRTSLAPRLPWLLTHLWLPLEVLLTRNLYKNGFVFINCGILYNPGLRSDFDEHSLRNTLSAILSVICLYRCHLFGKAVTFWYGLRYLYYSIIASDHFSTCKTVSF